MHQDIDAHEGTIFLSSNFNDISKGLLTHDYHTTFQGKRPNYMNIRDSYFFVTDSHDQSNLDQLVLVNDLIKKPYLKAVNFILLQHPDVVMEQVVKDQLISFIKEWNNHFKRNAHNGSLIMGISVQNFEATLLEGKVRGINRLSLGLAY